MVTENQLNSQGNRRGMSQNSQNNILKATHAPNHNKTKPVSLELKRLLNQPVEERWLPIEDKGKGLTWCQAIAKSLVIGALQGKPTQLTEVLERVDGKIALPVTGSLELHHDISFTVGKGYADKELKEG